MNMSSTTISRLFRPYRSKALALKNRIVMAPMTRSRAYAAMKGGIDVLTRYLAKELGPRGVAVNAVAPGAIETDFGGGVVRDNAALNKIIAGQTALGRVGMPEDIGPLIAALLSDSGRWVNGQRIEVSGGMLL
jgi:NAD(P)-dependent dehydrogenase (short-subunit alcohol dehydrogenase family)